MLSSEVLVFHNVFHCGIVSAQAVAVDGTCALALVKIRAAELHFVFVALAESEKIRVAGSVLFAVNNVECSTLSKRH